MPFVDPFKRGVGKIHRLPVVSGGFEKRGFDSQSSPRSSAFAQLEARLHRSIARSFYLASTRGGHPTRQIPVRCRRTLAKLQPTEASSVATSGAMAQRWAEAGLLGPLGYVWAIEEGGRGLVHSALAANRPFRF